MKSFFTSCFCSLVFLIPYASYLPSAYKVYVTKDKYSADLVVYMTHDKYQAKNSEYIWYMENNKYASNFSMQFTSGKYNSDLIVFFTNSKAEAGWRHSHPLRGKLNKN